MSKLGLNTTLADIEIERCRRSFTRFLRHWQFINRENGERLSFGDLWEGQREFAEQMVQHPWLFALKAGKLGFTELECAWDGWVALFRQPHARVHLFSKDQPASRELLGIVKFGIEHLPADWGIHFLSGKAGDDTSTSFRFRAVWMAADDARGIFSYPAVKNVAITQSATHSHVDEISHMLFARELWNSVSTTVPEGGSCHVLSRGAGDSVYSYELWENARAGVSRLVAFFTPWDRRPGRTAEYREQMAGSMTPAGLGYYLPITEEDALAGDETNPFIEMDIWDRLAEGPETLPRLEPGTREPFVISLDAGISGDCFGAAIATRHPLRHNEPALRAARVWRPQDFPSGRINFKEPERWVRFVISGGCRAGHPKLLPLPGCAHCDAGEWEIPPSPGALQLTYDPHQLEEMAQDLQRDGAIWVDAFDQGEERLIADAGLRHRAMAGTMAHNGDAQVREHIANARAKTQRDEESKIRIVKKSERLKIDLAVCVSMAFKRIMQYNV